MSPAYRDFSPSRLKEHKKDPADAQDIDAAWIDEHDRQR